MQFSHLTDRELLTIVHQIEMSRMALLEAANDPRDIHPDDIVGSWPPLYEALVKEAERRGLCL